MGNLNVATMPSRKSLAALALALLLFGAVVPVVANPGPREVSAFSYTFGADYGEPFPASNTTNVSLDAAVHANGTSVWTEHATLENPETVAAFRENRSLRRTAVAERFERRFEEPTSQLDSRLSGDTLVVTYRIDGAVERGVGGGTVFAPFADYRGWYVPGDADVSVHSPDGYAVVEAPDSFARSGDTLRWNESSATDTSLSPGLVTFAPEGALAPEVLATVANLEAFGASLLRVSLGQAAVLGLPLGLLASGVAALAGRRYSLPEGTVRATFAGGLVLSFLWTAVSMYPVPSAGLLHPFALFFFGPVLGAVALAGVGCHALARR
jgi:hypothetical protein